MEKLKINNKKIRSFSREQTKNIQGPIPGPYYVKCSELFPSPSKEYDHDGHPHFMLSTAVDRQQEQSARGGRRNLERPQQQQGKPPSQGMAAEEEEREENEEEVDIWLHGCCALWFFSIIIIIEFNLYLNIK